MNYSDAHIAAYQKFLRLGGHKDAAFALSAEEVSDICREDRETGLYIQRARTEAAEARYAEAERRYADAEHRGTAPPSTEPAIDWKAWQTACGEAMHADDPDAAWRALKAFVGDFKRNPKRARMYHTALPFLASIWAIRQQDKVRNTRIADVQAELITLQVEIAALKADHAADTQLEAIPARRAYGREPH